MEKLESHNNFVRGGAASLIILLAACGGGKNKESLDPLTTATVLPPPTTSTTVVEAQELAPPGAQQATTTVEIPTTTITAPTITIALEAPAEAQEFTFRKTGENYICSPMEVDPDAYTNKTVTGLIAEHHHKPAELGFGSAVYNFALHQPETYPGLNSPDFFNQPTVVIPDCSVL